MGPLVKARPFGIFSRPNPIKRLTATLKARRAKALYQEPTSQRAAADRRFYRLVLPIVRLHCKGSGLPRKLPIRASSKDASFASIM